MSQRVAPLTLSLLAVAILCGCAHPPQTYVDSDTMRPLERQGSYRFSLLPQAPNEIEVAALSLVQQNLATYGWTQTAEAPYLLTVTLAERPAEMAILGGDDAGKANRTIRGNARQQRIAGLSIARCVKQDHRITILMTRADTGNVHYAGSASQFDCKGEMPGILPNLVGAALADFGRRSYPRMMQ